MRSIGYSNYPLHLLESLFIIHAAPSTPHYPGLRIRELMRCTALALRCFAHHRMRHGYGPAVPPALPL